MKRLFLGVCLIVFLWSTAFAVSANDFLLPQDKNSYLEFENATDIAASSEKLAILCEDKIILQDRTSGDFHEINISFNAKKIFINESGIFLLRAGNLYYNDFVNDFEIVKSPVFNFAVKDSLILIDDAEKIELFEFDGSNFNSLKEPHYYTNEPKHLFFTGIDDEFSYLPHTVGIISAVGYNGEIYTVKQGGFYKDEQLLESGEFICGKIFNDSAFLLSDNKVIIYDFLTNDTTEISSSSNKDGRLGKGAGIAAANDKLYIADSINKRIIITDLQGKFLENISLNVEPKSISVYAEFIACTNQSGILILDTKNNTIKGISGNYSSISATKNKLYALLVSGESIDIFNYDGLKIDTINTSTLEISQIACDISGNLYCAETSGKVYKYSGEFEEIENFSASGGVKSLIIDIYANPSILDGNGNIFYGNITHTAQNAASIAYYYSSQNLFALYDYKVLIEKGFEVSSVKSVDVPDFNIQDNLEIKMLKKNRLFLEFDLNIATHERTYAPSETDSDTAVIILYKKDNYYIFSGKITGVAKESDFIDIDKPIRYEQDKLMYAATDFYGYKLPSLKELLRCSEASVKKGDEVEVLAKVAHSDLERDFYEILIDEKTYYIPDSFLKNYLVNFETLQNFGVIKLKPKTITVYLDSFLGEEKVQLTSVNAALLHSKNDKCAYVTIFNGGENISGYIDISLIKTADNSNARNVGAVVVLMLAATITTLFYIKRKLKNS